MADDRHAADAGAWNRIIRDFSCTATGVFLFVYGALEVREVNILAAMFGAGLILLGLPATLRLDQRRNGNGS